MFLAKEPFIQSSVESINIFGYTIWFADLDQC
jgi:hypothetical protein